MDGREMTRVLIVEDAEIVATGVRATIQQDSANDVVAAVPSVALASQVLDEQEVDVVVADIRLQDGTSFDLLRLMAAHGMRSAVLIVSSFDLAQYVEAALHTGASGYILKTAPAKELLMAIRTVAAGGWAFDPALVRRTADAKQLTLSDRDRQVVAAVVAGRSNDEIGLDLGISRKTVEARISRLFERFGVSSRVELVRRAEREQWLEPAVSEASRDQASYLERESGALAGSRVMCRDERRED